MMKKKILFSIALIFLGVSCRIFFNKMIKIPNFEAITGLSLVSGSFLGGIFAPILPLLIVFLSDIYLGFGHHPIYFFTWTAFILIGTFGIFFKRNSKYYFLKITSGGIASVFFFYLWTNFGWWLTFGMYPMTLAGLLQSYLAGLPFLKNQLISVLIFTPIFAFVFDKLFVKEAQKNEDLAFVSKISQNLLEF